MWRPWAKSAVKLVHHAPSQSQSQSQRFSCSSFKDIQQLCSPPWDDDGDHPSPSPSPSSPIPSPSKQQQVISRLILCRSLTLSDSPHSLICSDSAPPSHVLKPPAPAAAVTDPQSRLTTSPLQRPPPGIVIYYTSLHAVRPTFEACRTVQSILRGFRLKIDERDLSMDQRFLAELRELLEQGKAPHSTSLTLPQVFIGGKYVGGAEEIRQLHEIGELKKMVEGLPSAEAVAVAGPGECDACGGYRFGLCAECNGSRKLYVEKSGFKSCTACNENGLIRCPSCSLPTDQNQNQRQR